ncbi:MAG: Ig-like domain-containing protein [Oscillospiraceae bacterium]|nr:Ig-like domain-containing protein [Oscillospiraceae bacterium]MDY2847482.1 Ig-like domain-containing protein [Oscillospiraceae bacterium]
MKKIKRIITVLIAAAVSVAAMVSTAFTASARSVFDGAITMEEKELYSLDNVNIGDYVYYKITLKSSGDLTIRWSYGGGVNAELYDSNAYIIQESFFIGYNCADEITIENVKKGTYYLKVFGTQSYTACVRDLYYVFKSDGTAPADEPTAVIALRLKKGDTARVTVVTDDYDGSITWTSTKKSVATVSKGKITAKKKGNARIRAYLDDGSYTEILVIVEN